MLKKQPLQSFPVINLTTQSVAILTILLLLYQKNGGASLIYLILSMWQIFASNKLINLSKTYKTVFTTLKIVSLVFWFLSFLLIFSVSNVIAQNVASFTDIINFVIYSAILTGIFAKDYSIIFLLISIPFLLEILLTIIGYFHGFSFLFDSGDNKFSKEIKTNFKSEQLETDIKILKKKTSKDK